MNPQRGCRVSLHTCQLTAGSKPALAHVGSLLSSNLKDLNLQVLADSDAEAPGTLHLRATACHTPLLATRLMHRPNMICTRWTGAQAQIGIPLSLQSKRP